MHKYTHIMCMLNANLREEGVEAVDLLSLLHVGVVLCHALQRQLIHQVYGVRTVKVVPLCVYIHVHTYMQIYKRSTVITNYDIIALGREFGTKSTLACTE